MIKIENVEVVGWEPAIRGMRNSYNSWDKSDSYGMDEDFKIGPIDYSLMLKLAKSGPSHSKYRRMIVVYVDVTAPLYWWSEYDTYKVGTVSNSCSKMHTLLAKPFEMYDFSFDKLPGYRREIKQFRPEVDKESVNLFEKVARPFVDTLNELRDSYLTCDNPQQKKIIWYSILQLLPESYNQRRTLMLNYEVLSNVYKDRKSHKLDEWIEFCKWIEELPYSKLITLEDTKND